jgi:hypothetical protein
MNHEQNIQKQYAAALRKSDVLASISLLYSGFLADVLNLLTKKQQTQNFHLFPLHSCTDDSFTAVLVKNVYHLNMNKTKKYEFEKTSTQTSLQLHQYHENYIEWKYRTEYKNEEGNKSKESRSRFVVDDVANTRPTEGGTKRGTPRC